MLVDYETSIPSLVYARSQQSMVYRSSLAHGWFSMEGFCATQHMPTSLKHLLPGPLYNRCINLVYTILGRLALW